MLRKGFQDLACVLTTAEFKVLETLAMEDLNPSMLILSRS